MRVGARAIVKARAKAGSRVTFWSIVYKELLAITDIKASIIYPLIASISISKALILSIGYIIWAIIIINQKTIW